MEMSRIKVLNSAVLDEGRGLKVNANCARYTFLNFTLEYRATFQHYEIPLKADTSKNSQKILFFFGN